MSDAGTSLLWRRLLWQRRLDTARLAACLRVWAADQRNPQVVLEVRGSLSGVGYWLGTSASALPNVIAPLRQLRTTVLEPNIDREPVQAAGRLKTSTRHRPLRRDDPESVICAVLSALTHLRQDEQLVLQVILGPRRVPLAVPTQSPSSIVAPWWTVAWH